MRTRRTVTAAVLALGLVLGSAGAAWAGGPGGGPVGMTGGAGGNGGPRDGASPSRTGLPAGWEITTDRAGPLLVWHALERIPLGDSPVRFYTGDRLLGRPTPAGDQRTFRLRITGDGLAAGERGERNGGAGSGTAAPAGPVTPARLRPADLAGLGAWAGGRRLDAAGAGADRGTARRGAPPPPVLPDPLPANPVDPGRAGGYRTTSGEYALPGVRLPGFPERVEMRGVVVAPVGAPGARPLVLFLHGRHDTCYSPSDKELPGSGDWPCPAGWRPIPSHRGYLQAQRLLASQGYVTVSISANGINGQDFRADDGGAQARSTLIRLHLARWADWAGRGRSAAPAAVRAAPRADLSRVLLVGHSRGGEGVNRAALDTLYPPPADQDSYSGPVRWRIRGTLLIGPTIFGHNPAPEVPSVTVLPGCDGDVSDLQGEVYVDATRSLSRGAALNSALYVVGANHNFFNTEWTPGQAKAPALDDFSGEGLDSVCSPEPGALRLSAAEQQTVGATYIAATARLFLAGDDRVRPLLDGSGFRARSADPAYVVSHAVGAGRRQLVLPDESVKVTGKGARVCPEVHVDPAIACFGEDSSRSPHAVGFGWTSPEPGRHAVALSWSRPGRAVGLRPARPVSLAGSTSLALRVVVPPNSTGTRLEVALADASGRRATLGEIRPEGLPSSAHTASFWAREVRVPLAAAVRAGLDLDRVAELRLVPRGGQGKAWLLDAWGWRPGTPEPRPGALPRVDVGALRVDEGDSGVRTYRVPVRVSGRGEGRVWLFAIDPDTSETVTRLVTVRPGGNQIDLPVIVRGNTRFSYDRQYVVAVKAARGAVVGGYVGGVSIFNDDPMPEVTIAPVADRVPEGGKLRWRVTLSTEADSEIWEDLAVAPPPAGAELSTTDVDPAWLAEVTGGEKPLPERPLSGSLWLSASVPPGELSVDVVVPTVVDGLREPEEHLAMRTVSFPPDAEEPVFGPFITGTVVDAS